MLIWSSSLTKNGYIDKYKYFEYGVGFDRKGTFSYPGIEVDRNVIIFGVDMNSSTKIDNMEKDISILGKGSTQGLEHTLSAKKCINFTEKDKKFCLSLHYNRVNIYLLMAKKFINSKLKILRLLQLRYV